MANNEASAFKEQQRYDDDGYGFHPDDILIMKWFPNTEPHKLLDENERQQILNRALQDEYERPGVPYGPHRLLPLRPRSRLEPGVEEWRQLRLRMIDVCVASYSRLSSTPRQLRENDERTPQVLRSNGHSKGDRALGVPELLEQILQYLDPESQYAASLVSRSWRATSLYIVRTRYRSQYPCAPIEYNQTITVDVPWLRPTQEEISAMKTDFEYALQNPSRNMVNFFWPARLHQPLSLPSYIDVAYRQVWAQTIIAEYSLAPGPRWLDLSQVHFNPYFTALFEVCIRFPYGHCSIDLVPGQRYLTASPIIRSKELGDLVKGMFVTQPPCKALGIYVDGEGLHNRTKRINNVHSEEGVRIGQLLDSLEECIPEIIDH